MKHEWNKFSILKTEYPEFKKSQCVLYALLLTRATKLEGFYRIPE